jgi:hypothetical protein
VSSTVICTVSVHPHIDVTRHPAIMMLSRRVVQLFVGFLGFIALQHARHVGSGAAQPELPRLSRQSSTLHVGNLALAATVTPGDSGLAAGPTAFAEPVSEWGRKQHKPSRA